MSSIANNVVTRYFRESYEELRKVTWPSREDVVRYTIAIMVMGVVLGIYFGLADWLFSKGLEALVTISS